MCAIMEQLHTYVPTVSHTKELPTEDDGDPVLLDDFNFHRILLGGDQLTAARCRGSAAARGDHQTSLERLQGLTPVSEDWHSKRIFLMVCTDEL